MPATYEPIATTTLGSAASTITFSSIPATYTDLRLVFVGTGSSADANLDLRFNGDTSSATTYSGTYLRGQGTAASSVRLGNASSFLLGYFAVLSTTVPQFYSVDVFSYAGSTNKSALVEASGDRNGSGNVERSVHLYRNTAAITSITLTPGAGNFNAGTVATLYGILKA